MIDGEERSLKLDVAIIDLIPSTEYHVHVTFVRSFPNLN